MKKTDPHLDAIRLACGMWANAYEELVIIEQQRLAYKYASHDFDVLSLHSRGVVDNWKALVIAITDDLDFVALIENFLGSPQFDDVVDEHINRFTKQETGNAAIS